MTRAEARKLAKELQTKGKGSDKKGEAPANSTADPEEADAGQNCCYYLSQERQSEHH